MKTYRVVWEIDIEAETSEEAARVALGIQRDPESTAQVFTTWEHSDEGYSLPRVTVDLYAIDNPEGERGFP